LYRKSSRFVQIFQFFLFGLFFAGMTWMNSQLARDSLGGKEFYTQWAAGRALAYQARSPYQSQLRPTQDLARAPGLLGKNLSFNTPIYSLILVFPFLLIENYATAYSLWLLVLELAVLGILWTALALTDWRINRPLLIILLVSILLGFYTSQALLNGSLVILACLFLIGGIFNLQAGRNELAGVMFALTTVQAHLFWLVYLALFFWAGSTKRWKVLIWFLAGIGILSVMGIFVIPDWPYAYARVLWNFEEHFALKSLGAILTAALPGFGKQLGWAIAGFVGVILAVEFMLVRRQEVRWFNWTVGLSILVTPWIGIPVHPSIFFILTLPLLLVLSVWVQRTGRVGHWIVGFSLALFLLLSWGVVIRLGVPENILEPGLSHFFFLPVILWIGLYWTRWWAVRPQRLFIEELRDREAST
jgi:hypothetical protein